MDTFNKRLLTCLVSAFDSLSEREKTSGLESRVLTKALAGDLGIDQDFAYDPGFQGTDAFLKVLNVLTELEHQELIRLRSFIGGIAWMHPTQKGRDFVETWEKEARSPIAVGKRLLEYLYEKQQDVDEIMRREGIVDGIDVGDVCATLGISQKTYARAVRWSIRQGFADVSATHGSSLEDGDIYITTEGMSAVEEEFQSPQIQLGPTIDIHDNRVVGDIVAAGRDAMTISSPEISASEAEIMQLLDEIQSSIDSLGEDDDDRHDALQQVESLQREFSKQNPSPGRIERSLDAVGSMGSIGSLAAAPIARLIEIAGQLSG